jgi:hypothetical protein
MDPAEIRFIREFFIKDRGKEVFRKIHPSPILLEPFKDSAPSRTAVGKEETNCQWSAQICQRPFIYYICTAVGDGAMNKL